MTNTAYPSLTLRFADTTPVEAGAAGPAAPDISRLTAGLAKGDEAAFTEFHAQYFERLYRFLLVVARGNETEARDALQATFLKVLRYAREFDSEEAFWCWLKTLAASAARDAGRQRRRYFSLLDRFSQALKPQVAAPPIDDRTTLGDLLEEALNELDGSARELLMAKYVEGETVRDLSLARRTTEKAIESQLGRLRRELRERLLRKLRRL